MLPILNNQRTIMEVQEKCNNLMIDTFYDEYRNSLKSRKRLKTFINILDTMSYIFYGSTIIMSFLASSKIEIPYINLLAGCSGVCSTFCVGCSRACKTRLDSLSKTIEELSTKINIQNMLPMNNEQNATPAPDAVLRMARARRSAREDANLLHTSTNHPNYGTVINEELPQNVTGVAGRGNLHFLFSEQRSLNHVVNEVITDSASPTEECRAKAATKIQAIFKGYQVRRHAKPGL